MMKVILSLPSADIPVTFPHTMSAGGGALKIKHTHPTYGDRSQRMDRLREMKKICRSLARPKQQEKRVS